MLTKLCAILIFVAAAILEVSGDAAIRHGIKDGGGLFFIVLGFFGLGCYGLVINLVKTVPFSQLLGFYVAVFAVVSVLWGHFAGETIPRSTCFGLMLIVAGGLVIQYGH